MTLSKTLKELFTIEHKSQEMMWQDCQYDPDYMYKPYSYKTKTYGEPVSTPIETGYAKELDEIGVSYSVEASYGGEDMGSEYWTVWKFTKGDETCFFKFNGWYQSHVGSEFTDVEEVKPKQKTVTVWE